MKCQILFSGKNKKNIINLSSAENAQRVVKVKWHNGGCDREHHECQTIGAGHLVRKTKLGNPY